MNEITIDGLSRLVNAIDFSNDYREATFQFELMKKMFNSVGTNHLNIMAEININRYKLNKNNFIKKEIDIIVEDTSITPLVAIELKMPMNGQVPEQMYKFVQDIVFLEQLKYIGKINSCFFIAVTKNHLFWEGDEYNGIYEYFRKNHSISGTITKPTGEDVGKPLPELKNTYSINWNNCKKGNGFRYFILEI